MNVIKRDGRIVPYDPQRVVNAIAAAYAEARQISKDDLTAIHRVAIKRLAESAERSFPDDSISVEDIQDIIERKLMIAGEYDTAKLYIIYRENRSRERGSTGKARRTSIHVRHRDGLTQYLLEEQQIRQVLKSITNGIADVSVDGLFADLMATVQDGQQISHFYQTIILVARARIELEPNYTKVAARQVLDITAAEVLDTDVHSVQVDRYQTDLRIRNLEPTLTLGVNEGLIDPRLIEPNRFDLGRLSEAIRNSRDQLFDYLGVQTLYDRYLLKVGNRRIETPQQMWMRVAMGLAINEDNPTVRAIEFYDQLSSFFLCSSTPTLFNSGTLHPQMSSCYLLTQEDSLSSIFKNYADTAQLSKWAGGIGVDYTPLRGTDSYIKGVNGRSGGTVPWLKIMNDTVAGVSQAGKRRGSAAAYMEVWHSDILQFLDLRKNTGDDRIRTHDLNTAVWINDLFMERVLADQDWTLFSPNDAPKLHDAYGNEFKRLYREYEYTVPPELTTKIKAKDLYRMILSALFETGHPWITFKDPSNIRYSNSHVGVVHSSNLCTEILLHTNTDEVAVCNLLSINLPSFVGEDGKVNGWLLRDSVTTAIRMLDNVIDLNFYPIPEAETSNKRHRPVGLGQMGFQDVLWKRGLSYASPEAVKLADTLMESISYFAIDASAALAQERGSYETFGGSLWNRGVLPIDSQRLLANHREHGHLELNTETILDWGAIRERAQRGMRNSNVMAIAPTATIANIQGVTQSIEPQFSNLYVKSNLSGQFTVVNKYLVADLKKLGLWNKELLDEIKYWDGSIQAIERIPYEIRLRYPTAFEIDPEWLIDAAARRQKWIDMGQSLNLYIAEPSGKRLSDMYMLAWRKGLKTTYYLRSRGATTTEKSTIDINRFGIQPRWMKSQSASSEIRVDRGDMTLGVGATSTEPAARESEEHNISVDDFEDLICEACQ